MQKAPKSASKRNCKSDVSKSSSKSKKKTDSGVPRADEPHGAAYDFSEFVPLPPEEDNVEPFDNWGGFVEEYQEVEAVEEDDATCETVSYGTSFSDADADEPQSPSFYAFAMGNSKKRSSEKKRPNSAGVLRAPFGSSSSSSKLGGRNFGDMDGEDADGCDSPAPKKRSIFSDSPQSSRKSTCSFGIGIYSNTRPRAYSTRVQPDYDDDIY